MKLSKTAFYLIFALNFSNIHGLIPDSSTIKPDSLGQQTATLQEIIQQQNAQISQLEQSSIQSQHSLALAITDNQSVLQPCIANLNVSNQSLTSQNLILQEESRRLAVDNQTRNSENRSLQQGNIKLERKNESYKTIAATAALIGLIDPLEKDIYKEKGLSVSEINKKMVGERLFACTIACITQQYWVAIPCIFSIIKINIDRHFKNKKS